MDLNPAQKRLVEAEPGVQSEQARVLGKVIGIVKPERAETG